MNAEFLKFVEASGLKILAMARLTQSEYSVVFYLLNCAVSGLDQLITNESEFSSLIGYNENELVSALQKLGQRQIIRVYYGDKSHKRSEHYSFRVGMQYDVNKWILDYGVDVSAKDAVVYPFIRQDAAALQILQKPNNKPFSSWERVYNEFRKHRDLNDEEDELAREASRVLVETHPTDQVLLVLRYFQDRISNLSLLASSWQHYQELFENETQKVDFADARSKHRELDDRVRADASKLLETKGDSLTEEETTVLQILTKHRHPRRQLFWAYQLRSRYENLMNFFSRNHEVMLPVTSQGNMVRKPTTTDNESS